MYLSNSILADLHTASINRSLILAGGGARLAYQAGVLQALEEEGLIFSHFDGTSGGIFNTAMLSSGIEPREMARRWRKVKMMNFSSLLSFKSYFSKKTFAAFGDADGIVNKVYPALGIDVAKMNANSAIDATFNVCNFSKKTIEVFTNRNVTLQHLVAGMSLPVFMPALKINGDWYTDAVWIKDANITEALTRNPKEIWLVWAIGNSHEFLNGAFNQYVHMIEISANGGLLLELEQIEKINRERLPQEKIILHVIKPEFPLPLDPDLMFNKINVDELINRGYADAKDYLKRKTDEGVAPDYQASLMKEPGAVLVFRSKFSGKMEWNGKTTEISWNINFNFRQTNPELVLRAYSSVSFDNSPDRIPTFNNSVSIGKNMLEYSCNLILNNETIHLHGRMNLISPFDLLLGLEFKQMHFSLLREQNSNPDSVILKQKAWCRIKNTLFIHVNSSGGFRRKWKEKFSILNEVYNQ